MKIRFYKRNKTYGGSEYIVLNTEENSIIRGNTASTAWDYRADIDVEIATYKKLRDIQERLYLSGVEDKGRK